VFRDVVPQKKSFTVFHHRISEITTNMSVVLLKLLHDGTVKDMTTRDGMQVFSVYDFIKLVCQKMNSTQNVYGDN
jgi:hypothetical protein